MMTLTLLAAAQAVADTMAGANPVLTPVASGEPQMNLWDMACKGGWIMIVLALMSVIAFYIFFERAVAIRNQHYQSDDQHDHDDRTIFPVNFDPFLQKLHHRICNHRKNHSHHKRHKIDQQFWKKCEHKNQQKHCPKQIACNF